MGAGLLYCDNHVVMKFSSKYLFLWWHELANTLRLVRLRRSFLQIIKNFSPRQRLHFLLILLYGLHFLSILDLMLKGLLSYSCMPNMKSIMVSHNTTVLSNYTSTPGTEHVKECNCRKKEHLCSSKELEFSALLKSIQLN